MRKITALLSTILAISLFVACGSDDDYGTNNNYDLRNSYEYATYSTNAYGFVGDVKTVTRVYKEMPATANPSPADGVPIGKDVYQFDEEGFLKNSELYKNKPNSSSKYYEANEEVKFDGRYRIIGANSFVRKTNNSENMQSLARQEDTEYNEVAGIATTYIHNVYEDNSFTDAKIEQTIDGNGRLSAKTSDDYTQKTYHLKLPSFATSNSKNTYADAGTTPPSQWMPNGSISNKTFVSKDLKGNITRSYGYTATTDGKGTQTIAMSDYYEQTITYYDGTTSESISTSATMEGGGYVAIKSTNLDLVGNISTLNRTIYANSTWNVDTEKITDGQAVRNEKYTFDSGNTVSEIIFSNFNQEGQPIPVYKANYRYDAKGRITRESTQRTNTISAIVSTTIVDIVYNDSKQTARATTSQKEATAEEATHIETIDYQLANDGTISLNNATKIEEQPVPAVLARSTKASDADFDTSPGVIDHYRKTRDAQGNSIEQYEVSIHYINTGTSTAQSIIVYNHMKQEIAYGKK